MIPERFGAPRPTQCRVRIMCLTVGSREFVEGRGRVTRNREASGVPPVIERFVKSLVVTAKAVVLYPPASNMPLQTAEGTESLLREALRERSELRLVITPDALIYRDEPLFPASAAYAAFASDLHARGLTEVRFHSGARARDIVAFLSVLKYDAEQIDAAGGYEGRLWEQGVGTITVSEARESVADTEPAGERNEPRELTHDEIDDALTAARRGSVAETVVVLRWLEETSVVIGYLTETYSAAEPEGGPSVAGERLSALVNVASLSADQGSRNDRLDSLAYAFSQLDADVRRTLLIATVLPEARTSDALASFVLRFDAKDACAMLVQGSEEAELSPGELARAIRTLAEVLPLSRDEVADFAREAFVEQGLTGGFVAEVAEMVAPRQLTVDEEAAPAVGARLASPGAEPPAAAGLEQGTDREALVEEAARGITDAEVTVALAFLAGVDAEVEQFSPAMAALEDRLDVLVSCGELEAAADAVDELRAAARDVELGTAQRNRLTAAVQRLAKPSDLRGIARALHTFVPGTAEHVAARRLVDALGDSPIESLLEQLADEPDMGLRKSLVDLLSLVAPRHIPEFGARIGDTRWYVVRNIVCVLGSTHSSAVLPYLQRTLRHEEPRVRRETVRALSGIDDRVAHELLVAALSDDDDQNVQLAARYLGSAGVRSAVHALEEVAKGEGRGSREMGPRVEAIEALGKIGDDQTLRVLESLAGRRSLLRGSRGRELRAAAQAAIEMMKDSGGAS